MFSAQGAQYGISIGKQSFPNSPGGGGDTARIWALQVCAVMKGMVFKQFTLG